MEHMLVECGALEGKRTLLIKHIHEQTEDNLELRAVIRAEMSSSLTNTVQFLLDPSVVFSVQDSVLKNKFTLQEVFAITRTPIVRKIQLSVNNTYYNEIVIYYA